MNSRSQKSRAKPAMAFPDIRGGNHETCPRPPFCADSPSLSPQSPRTRPLWRTISGIAAAILAATLPFGCRRPDDDRHQCHRFVQRHARRREEAWLGQFSCTGAPTCNGQYREEYRNPGCSNSLIASDAISITGVNLGQSGPLQGSFFFKNWDFGWTVNANGTCTINPGTYSDSTASDSGSWNLATTTANFNILVFFEGATVPGTFKADITAAAPVFPMVVRSSIDSVSATATADIQFRPQDVGTNGSIYTFAVAPATLVKGGLSPKAMFIGYAKSAVKADPPPVCVLAQLSSTGQLVAVTAAQLQAYLSGTLSAQGASVNILNGVSTPTVAGATFYVGYGASSTTMINEGVYRSAVTVPGTSVCPMLSSQTALWWNPAESGWGLNLNHQGNIIFATLFTYDASGAPLWLVMSNGAMQSDGATFSGDLYRTTGPAFDAIPFTPIGAANVTKVGTMTVSFTDVNGGTLRYTVNGVEVNKAIQRQVFGTRAAGCFPTVGSRLAVTNYQDLWWNAAESGWGVNVTHQDNTLFATLFTYDATGRDLWLVMSAGQRQPDGSYLGDLYRTSGPAFNAIPFTPIGAANVTTVGTMRFRFSNGEERHADLHLQRQNGNEGNYQAGVFKSSALVQLGGSLKFAGREIEFCTAYPFSKGSRLMPGSLFCILERGRFHVMNGPEIPRQVS